MILLVKLLHAPQVNGSVCNQRPNGELTSKAAKTSKSAKHCRHHKVLVMGINSLQYSSNITTTTIV